MSLLKISTMKGFQIADSKNLPKVDYIMLLEYMQENERYSSTEIRSAQALLTSREAHIETAVGYVEVKRVGDLCTIQCRLSPENLEHNKLYLVTAVVDESVEKIVTIQCNNCNCSGGCKHAIHFGIWLIKRSNEPLCTSILSYWSKPKFSRSVDDQKHILPKNTAKKRSTPVDRDLSVHLSMFVNECKRRNVKSGMILNYCGNNPLQLRDFSIFNLILQFVHQTDNHSFKNFKLFSQHTITFDEIKNIAKLTKQRANSTLWHSMHQGRVMGSRIYECINCKTEYDTLVQSILGGYNVPKEIATKKGKDIKREVLHELEKEYGTMEVTGLILVSPIIGISPDRICNKFVIEVKCPLSEKTKTKYIKDDKLQEKYKAQMMVQMHGTKKLQGLFCIADPSFEHTKVIHKYIVEYNESYTNHLLEAAEEFWKQFVFNTILEMTK